MNNWIAIQDQQPPENYLKVKDEMGVEGIAIPTYYPFKIEVRPGDELKLYGLRGTVVPCESYWDGGWMIECTETLGVSNIGKITHWRHIENNQEDV